VKWPLFIIERLFNYSPVTLVVLTILVSVVTVAGLAYILYRIDRRPKVIGTVFLALACILLFIPAQPHAGGLLPVNFAMLATRNIEYLFYILSLVLIVRTPRIRNLQTVLAIVVLTLLISSDKLFMWISLGGAGLMIATYLIARRTTLVKIGLRWLALTVLSFVISTALLWALNASGLTHIVGDDSPYGLATTIKQIVLGIIFGLTGLLTNFGANPAFDSGIVSDIPKVFFERMLSPIAVPVLINGSLFIGGLIAAIGVFRKSLKPVKIDKRRKVQIEFSVATLLTLTLIASSIVAIGLFVGTNHYYPVDSRYETIVLFALSVAIVTSIRTRAFKKMPIKRIVSILLFGIAIGSIWAFTTHTQQSQALDTINARNTKISEVILNHKTDLLLGDYWRVVPISQVNTKVVNRILPLADCTTPRTVLTSESWQKDFKQHSFTYLLSLDKSPADYPKCSIDQVVEAFGRPNASALIAGTNEDPEELLLFYDGGANKNHNLMSLSKTATILPTTTDQQTNLPAECADDVTIMNIVAHEDDDLLFMNPDIQRAIDAKHCVRTVYVTAGDAGAGSQYWLGRERASEAAYETMLKVNQPLVWVQRTVKLSDHEFVSIASPRGHREISLVYMHLPDGNLNGQGYGVSGFESLERLRTGRVSTIRTVDNQSNYSSADLTGALTSLMDFYLPTAINTQASGDMGQVYHDHDDHVSVGKYVDSAYQKYIKRSDTPLNHYIGYPIRESAQNVFGDDLALKTKAFLAYATFDGSVCQSQAMCDQTPTYNGYLQRQYRR
jgi:LmbE family N-acetylglucosaminyl deacetylase